VKNWTGINPPVGWLTGMILINSEAWETGVAMTSNFW
jgi:hypothetical protein